jgi:hypothetical protein
MIVNGVKEAGGVEENERSLIMSVEKTCAAILFAAEMTPNIG